MIDFDEIRKEVFIRHGESINLNDPVLMLVTMNELVLQRYVEILLEKQREHMKALEAAQQKGLAEAKITAGRVITDASNYASDQAGDRVRIVMNEGITKLRKELELKQEKTASELRISVKFMFGAIVLGNLLAYLFWSFVS